MPSTTRSPFNLAARLFAAALFVAVLGGVTLSAWAQPAPGGHAMHGGMMGMPMRGRMLEHMLDSVNATADQRTQITQITTAARASMKAQWQAGRALRVQLLQLLTAPVVDANAVEAVRQQMLQQHDTMSKNMMQTMVSIANVLTPAQRAQLAANMAARAAKMQNKTQ